MAAALCWVSLAAACVAGAARKLGDFDLPWHLATGRAFVLHRSIMATDDFSYTFRGTAVRSEPLADVALYLVHRAGGTPGLQLLAAVLIGALAALLVARAALGRSRRARLLGTALAGLALVAAAPWFVLRPALLAFPLFAAELLAIDAHRLSGRRRAIAALIPLQLAWANAHGSAPLGLAVAAGYALYAMACRLARGRLGALLPETEGRAAPAALVVAAAATLATCLAPSGLTIFVEPFQVWGYGAWTTEWAPTTAGFVISHDPALLALGAVTLVALVAAWRSGPARPALFDLALAAGTMALAASRVRLIPLFAIAAAPIATRFLAPVIETARSLPFAAVALVAAAVPAVLVAPGARPGGGWDADNLPLAATEFAAAHKIAGPLWNFLPFGGWIAWRLHPATRVFIDGRAAKLYAEAFLAEYHRAGSDPAVFAALQQRWGFSWAMVRARMGERFDAALAADPSWAMVYLDDSAAIYVHRGGPDDALAASGYRRLRHLTAPAALFGELVATGRPPRLGALDDLAHDAELAVEQAPKSLRANFIAATIALASGDERAAMARGLALAAIDPRFEGTSLIHDELCRRGAYSPGLRPTRDR